LDEHLSAEGLPNWISGVFNISLSTDDFIVINSIGFAAVLVIITLYSLDKIGHFFPAALGILFFTNGALHLIVSIFTASLSPGTISGALLYIPLGVLIFRRVFPALNEVQCSLAIVTGIIIQIIVSVVAFNI
jgi:hypothetical protein